ncbi:MAG TPA: tetratricopeptide repeat protein [Bacteroidia bacterium]|jgi:Flp pilus assembly protein TadD|nr:tetratricopeptide repeat protein [Bacteroidia bacterium]
MRKTIIFSGLSILFLYGCDTYTDKNGDKKVILYETEINKVSRAKDQAYELIQTGKEQEALKILEDIVNENKTDKEVYYYLAIANGMLEKNEEAIRNCSEAIKLDPNYSSAYLNRGLLKCKLSKNEDALLDLNKAISINPKDPDSYMNRSIIYSALKQKDKACEDIKKAKELGGQIPEQLYKMTCE